MSTIDDIKTRLDIVEVVRGYVPELRKMGRTWKARCPFHSERTPSFNVDPERGTWHCFGSCATGGDVIEFVRRKEGLDFREALRLCAERAGVELRPPSPRETEEREQHARLLAANEAAAVFYQAALAGPDGVEARAYVAKRGLDDATCSTWQLGYAPDGWRSLTDHLVARGFTEADLVEAGLAVRSEGRDSVYDRFRDRLIFPTRDARRRLIGFGARALKPEDEPKYLNTPQTPLFDKSGNLYGLDRAAEAARRADQAIVVEGYMDVIAAHQFGFENVVASNGTAITEKQMALLKRYTQNVVLALDADEAGSEAALRGVEVAAGVADRIGVATMGFGGLVTFQDTYDAEIRVAALQRGPNGQKDDPDSLVRRDAAAFRQLIADAPPLLEHIFASAIARGATASDDPRASARMVEALLPTLARIGNDVIRARYVTRLARTAHVDESVIMKLLAQHAAKQRSGPRPVATPREVAQAKRTPPATPDGEAQLLTLLLRRREARAAGLELDPVTFEDAVNRALFEAWVAQPDLDERVAELDDLLRERYAELGAPAVSGSAVADYEPRHLPAMVADMAHRLRLGRAAARLRAVVLEQAQAAQTARRDGVAASMVRGDADAADPLDTEGETADVSAVDEFNATVLRQRELTREFQVATGRRSPDVDPVSQ